MCYAHHSVVKVLAAKVGIAGRGLHLKDALLNGENRHVERAAAKVEDKHVAFAHLPLLLVQAVGQRRRRRLVYDAQHAQPGDHAGVLRADFLVCKMASLCSLTCRFNGMFNCKRMRIFYRRCASLCMR